MGVVREVFLINVGTKRLLWKEGILRVGSAAGKDVDRMMGGL